LRIGDAALARDPLSGQGLATAISDALCAASALGNEDSLRLLQLRQEEQRAAHLLTLAHSAGDCRFQHEQVWREYSEFLAQHLDSKRMGPRIALDRGKLMLLANEQSPTLDTNHRNDRRSESAARASNRYVSMEIPR
jgi:2-polyprenyl-6-methoxyphenol hydroxylase-like FAD-dependent oxidoreductase